MGYLTDTEEPYAPLSIYPRPPIPIPPTPSRRRHYTREEGRPPPPPPSAGGRRRSAPAPGRCCSAAPSLDLGAAAGPSAGQASFPSPFRSLVAALCLFLLLLLVRSAVASAGSVLILNLLRPPDLSNHCSGAPLTKSERHLSHGEFDRRMCPLAPCLFKLVFSLSTVVCVALF